MQVRIMLPELKVGLERWKWSREFGMYVSTHGRFRDANKQPIRQFVGNGYLRVRTKYGIALSHRIVMRTWKPTEDMDHLTVDHLDHNTRNNRIENLEWVTKEENQRRAQEDCGGPAPELTDPVNPTGPQIKAYVRRAGENVYVDKVFGSAREAAAWLWEQDKSFRNSNTIAHMTQKIKNATVSKNLYCTYYWEAVK